MIAQLLCLLLLLLLGHSACLHLSHSVSSSAVHIGLLCGCCCVSSQLPPHLPCQFPSGTQQRMADYVQLLLQEIRATTPLPGQQPLRSISFGGGVSVM